MGYGAGPSTPCPAAGGLGGDLGCVPGAAQDACQAEGRGVEGGAGPLTEVLQQGKGKYYLVVRHWGIGANSSASIMTACDLQHGQPASRQAQPSRGHGQHTEYKAYKAYKTNTNSTLSAAQSMRLKLFPSLHPAVRYGPTACT